MRIGRLGGNVRGLWGITLGRLRGIALRRLRRIGILRGDPGGGAEPAVAGCRHSGATWRSARAARRPRGAGAAAGAGREGSGRLAGTCGGGLRAGRTGGGVRGWLRGAGAGRGSRGGAAAGRGTFRATGFAGWAGEGEASRGPPRPSPILTGWIVRLGSTSAPQDGQRRASSPIGFPQASQASDMASLRVSIRGGRGEWAEPSLRTSGHGSSAFARHSSAGSTADSKHGV